MTRKKAAAKAKTTRATKKAPARATAKKPTRGGRTPERVASAARVPAAAPAATAAMRDKYRQPGAPWWKAHL